MAVDDTVPSFPTYADLTQTLGWAGAAPAAIATTTASANVELSQGSRYTEQSVLGVGGMGKVVLARDARIGREVALKVLHAERELAEEERERFLREAQVQGQLEHPSIVPVYDIDRRLDGTTFFTMRRVLGRTLGTILDELRAGNADAVARYTQRELLQAFATVCLTIDYAHSRGVVHRDLKPANLMLGDFGEVYVLDWGLARIMEDPAEAIPPANRLSVPGTMMGTPLYMAPEQMADPDVGPLADVYSLGAILFEILTLERVRDPRALYAPVEARPSVRAPHRKIAPELETICVKATELDATERYRSARAIQEAIARYLDGDRETEQRRALAATHAERARAALQNAELATMDYEAERGTAMRELVRALALDPTHAEHVAMLAEIMSTPPRAIPPEVQHNVAQQHQWLVRAGSRYSAVAMLSWFLFFPILFALGIQRLDYVLAVAIPAAVTAGLNLYASRQSQIGRGIQYAMIGTMMVAGMTLSRMFGPLILMPTILATWAIVAQAHPDASMRRFCLAAVSVAMVVPIVLELGGVVPASYSFSDGRFEVIPQMHGLPTIPTLLFLGLANVAIAVLPAMFVARLRADLSRAQERELVQTWHFRRLGDDLIRASS